MSKYTPGPWEVGEYGSTVVTAYTPDRERVSGCGCDNNFVSDLNDGDYHIYESEEEQRANAYLIAAAPEMLEVLEWLFSRYRKEEETCLEHYERLAEQFYLETGRLAPGKSEPLNGCHPNEKEKAETQHVWDSWNREGFYKVQAAIKKARGEENKPEDDL